MYSLGGNIFCAICVSALLAVIEPIVKASLYSLRLSSLPAPGALKIPVDRVNVRALRDSWHVTRDGGRRRHEGIDIFAPRGTPVRATTEGIVTRVGSTALGGRVVWVLGPGGQRHYYAHLDRFAGVYAGQRIEAGIVLGYVGNTGNARQTPAHLHYGIYTSGGAINPFPLLRGGAAASSAKAGSLINRGFGP
jgi:murein DD-endopeptidase MepM/ murein hydrolase activator NlpD